MRSLVGTLAKAVTRPTDKAPVPFVSRRASMGLGWTVPAGMEQQMRAMGAVGSLFSIVDRICTAVAQADWTLYRASTTGEPEDRKPVTSHAAIDLWEQPNPFMARQGFLESQQQHIELTGEAWWLIGRDERFRAAGPLELWPVRPDRMEPVPDPETFLSHYIYRSPDGEQIRLELDDVVFLRKPHPLDPYRGMGAVQTILADLDATKLSAEWNRNFFYNSAEPGGIIEVDEKLEDDEYDEMVAAWRDQHRGVANAHRVAIIERARWVERKYTNRDMQFVELREASRETIRDAFGFPKPLTGAVDEVNRANAEAAEVVFARWLIKQRLERIKQALNTRLLPMFGTTTRGLEWDYDNPVPDDREADDRERKSKAEAFKIYMDAGVEPASACDVVGLPELEMAPKPEPPPVVQPPAIAPVPEPPAIEPAARAHVHIRAAETADDGTVLPDLAPVQAAWTTALDSLLRRWTGITRDWIRALIARIRDLIEDDDVTGLSSLEVDTDDATEALTAALVDLAGLAAAQVVDEAAAQGVEVTAGEVPAGTLAQIATVTAALLASELATSAAREALRVWSPDARVGDVTDAVTRHLESLTDARPRLHLGGALTSAQHEGRAATFRHAETTGGAGGGDGDGEGGAGGEDRALPSVAYYGQEILDDNTCTLCREVDGRWLGNTYAEAIREYPAGGYIRCLGTIRCRGQVVAAWRGGSDQSGWIEKETVP